MRHSISVARLPISSPGVYQIPIDVYHNDPHVCAGPSISSSGLKYFELGKQRSPAHFFAQWCGNPKAEKTDTAAFRLGKAAAAYMLGDEVFLARFAILPFADLRTNDAKHWKAQQERRGLTVINEQDLATVASMAETLKAHPIVKLGILDGAQELSLVWKDKETGVWLRSRPDLIPNDLMGSDYKTAADASPHTIVKTIVDHLYHMQAALVMEGFENVLDKRLEDYALIFQEKTPPYVVNPFMLSPDAIARGRVLNRRAVRLFADCLEKNDWPGYPEFALPIDTPNWYNEAFEKRQEAGELPSYYDAGLRVAKPEPTTSKPVSDPFV